MKQFLFFVMLTVIPFLLCAEIIIQPGSVLLNNDRDGRIQQIAIENSYDNVWILNERIQFHYNPTYPNQVDSISWLNREDDTWLANRTTILTYDATHQYVLSAVIHQYNNEVTELGNSRYVYDAQNRLIHIYSSQLFMMSTMTFRYHFTYTGQQLSGLLSMMSAFDNAQYSYNTFTNDAQGRILTSTAQLSPDSTNWVNNSKYVYTYHPSDITTGASYVEYLAEYYPLASLSGEGMYFGKLATDILSSYVNNEWVERYRNTYTYNGLNLLVNKLNESDSDGSDVWLVSAQNLYTYDANANLSVDESQNYNQVTGWSDFIRKTYTWDNGSAADDPTATPISPLALQISPNPFSDKVSIQCLTRDKKPIHISIYNLKGQLVHRQNISADEKMEWNGLASDGRKTATGIYLVKATQGSKCTSSKIVRIQ